MHQQNKFFTGVCFILLVFFFANCSTYGPATLGNIPAHITRPMYEDETVSAINLNARASTGDVYSYKKGEINRFGEGAVSYSRVFKEGHFAVNAGGYMGSYFTKNQLSTPLRYYGSNLRAELGIHTPPLWQSFVGRHVRTVAETTFGICYEYRTEDGEYFNFRKNFTDSLSKNNPNRSINSTTSHRMHTISVFKDYRQQINDTDIFGVRAQTSLSYEGNFVQDFNNMQMGLTIHYTHKMFTIYGQGSFSLGSYAAYFKPLFGLGINYAVWMK